MKANQWCNCEMCGIKIERKQGEERLCVSCELMIKDGDDINNEHGDN
jgi:hypothetical protein